MRNLFGMIRDAISDMRYGSSAEVALYWFIRVASILVPVFIVLIIVGVVYCKLNGIEIMLPF